MSAICNSSIALSVPALRNKKRLAQAAGREVLGATGEIFKALELHEREDGTNTTAVYVSAARTRLAQARELLAEVRALLLSGTPRTELMEWYGRVDYDRFYDEGVAAGMFAASRELWTEVVRPLAEGGPVASCDAHVARVEQTAALADQWLADRNPVTLIRLESAMVELNMYVRLAACFNEVPPLDRAWLREEVRAGG